MLGDELLPEERPERMAEEDDRNARLLLGDQPVHGPEIADDFAPSAVVGEMAEVGGRGPRPVAAMVVRINRIARGVERRGEAGVTGAVLGEAVGDLHHRPRPPFRQPAPGQKALPVVGPKLELAPRHSRPSRPGLRPAFGPCCSSEAPASSSLRQGRARLDFRKRGFEPPKGSRLWQDWALCHWDREPAQLRRLNF